MSGPLRQYFVHSRKLSVSLMLVLPLLAAYEIGILASRSQVENHAGLLVKRMIRSFGLDGYVWLTAGVAVLFVVALVVKYARSERSFALYPWMLLEAAAYAALLGPIVLRTRGWILALSAAPSTGDLFMGALLSTGAGVWEEIVFRLLLLGGLVAVFVRILRGNRLAFTVTSLLVSAALFALFHHVGSMAEPFTTGAFLFRFVAGMVLGAIFLVRGLAVCVYTHGFYNVGLLLWAALGTS